MERKIEDLPEYVKLEFDSRIHFVHKVEKWIGENSSGQPLYEYYNKVNYLSTFCILNLTPTTREEYEQYQSK